MPVQSFHISFQAAVCIVLPWSASVYFERVFVILRFAFISILLYEMKYIRTDNEFVINSKILHKAFCLIVYRNIRPKIRWTSSDYRFYYLSLPSPSPCSRCCLNILQSMRLQIFLSTWANFEQIHQINLLLWAL